MLTMILKMMHHPAAPGPIGKVEETTRRDLVVETVEVMMATTVVMKRTAAAERGKMMKEIIGNSTADSSSPPKPCDGGDLTCFQPWLEKLKSEMSSKWEPWEDILKVMEECTVFNVTRNVIGKIGASVDSPFFHLSLAVMRCWQHVTLRTK